MIFITNMFKILFDLIFGLRSLTFKYNCQSVVSNCNHTNVYKYLTNVAHDLRIEKYLAIEKCHNGNLYINFNICTHYYLH